MTDCGGSIIVLRSFRDYEAHANKENRAGTDLVRHGFGPSTNVDQEDRGQRQLDLQSQSVPCRNVPGSVDTRVLTQGDTIRGSEHLQCGSARDGSGQRSTCTLRRRLNCWAVG